MAVTFCGLWPALVSWENLGLAYEKARRGKTRRPDVARFEVRREENLLALRDALADGSWRPGGYRHFLIRRPKERRISAAPFADRVVHHAIVNVLEPVYEPRFVYDSYACRVGKGQHRAVRRCRRFLAAHPFVLRGDIEKFFPSVDHALLLDVVGRRIRDPRVMELLARVLASGAGVLEDRAASPWFPGDDLFACLRPRGLPIGNLTSQFLANVLLDVLDHFVAEEIRPGGYVRYCDDFVIFSRDRKALVRALADVRRLLASLRLHLHPAKACVQPSALGLPFLGYRVHASGVRLLRPGISRANARMRAQALALGARRTGRESVRASVRAWLGHARHANAHAITRTLLSRHGLAWAVR